jgi:NADPH-dependent ferric siderophore reductase
MSASLPPPPDDGSRPVDVLTVVAVMPVTPSVRRVTLRGSADAVAAAGPTVKLLVPRPEDPSPRWPAVARDGRVVWPAGALGHRPAEVLLLAADETALPAVARILAEADPATRGTALLEVAGAEEEQEVPAPPGVVVRWLHRGTTAPGESTLLAEAVAALPRPAGDVFAWVGAESAAVRAIRADLRSRWGLTRSEHHAIGYWRRGRAMSG